MGLSVVGGSKYRNVECFLLYLFSNFYQKIRRQAGDWFCLLHLVPSENIYLVKLRPDIWILVIKDIWIIMRPDIWILVRHHIWFLVRKTIEDKTKTLFVMSHTF